MGYAEVHLKCDSRNPTKRLAVSKYLGSYLFRPAHQQRPGWPILGVESSSCNRRKSSFFTNSCKYLCIAGIVLVDGLFPAIGNEPQRVQSDFEMIR